MQQAEAVDIFKGKPVRDSLGSVSFAVSCNLGIQQSRDPRISRCEGSHEALHISCRFSTNTSCTAKYCLLVGVAKNTSMLLEILNFAN